MADRTREKLEAMLRCCRAFADLSCCRVRRHGCIVFPADMSSVLAVGYNGPSRGQPNDACTGEDGSRCGCAHAESNALVKLRSERRGLVLMCTKSPCLGCAHAIANSGAVSLVVYAEQWSGHEQSSLALMMARIGVSDMAGAAVLLRDLQRTQAEGRFLA